MKNSTPLPFGSTKFLNSQTGLRCRVGPAYKHSVSQLFHGPAPRSPLHRLAVRLRHSRSNTSTEYSLPGATQLSQVRSVSPSPAPRSPLHTGSASQCSDGLCLGCESVTNTTSPQCLRNPQGREGGARQQQQHAKANEVASSLSEADKGRRTIARPFRIWIRYGCGTQCMHARPGRLAGSPAGSPHSHPH